MKEDQRRVSGGSVSQGFLGLKVRISRRSGRVGLHASLFGIIVMAYRVLVVSKNAGSTSENFLSAFTNPVFNRLSR